MLQVTTRCKLYILSIHKLSWQNNVPFVREWHLFSNVTYWVNLMNWRPTVDIGQPLRLRCCPHNGITLGKWIQGITGELATQTVLSTDSQIRYNYLPKSKSVREHRPAVPNTLPSCSSNTMLTSSSSIQSYKQQCEWRQQRSVCYVIHYRHSGKLNGILLNNRT